jgi:DNA-binding MarR family transcriptional regulator
VLSNWQYVVMSEVQHKSRTSSAEAFTQLILEVFQLNGRLLAAGDQLTKGLGLSSALWQVLGAIDDEALPVSQIARNMGLTRQGVLRTANALEKKGFVEYQDNPNHQRAKLVVLTDNGRESLDKVSALQIEWANKIADGIGEDDLNAAIRTIHGLYERL